MRFIVGIFILPCLLWWCAALLFFRFEWNRLDILLFIFLALFLPAALLSMAMQYRLAAGKLPPCLLQAKKSAFIHALWYAAVLVFVIWFYDFRAVMFFVFIPYMLIFALFNFLLYSTSAWLALRNHNNDDRRSMP